jgi:PAS domain S-box-containing protein
MTTKTAVNILLVDDEPANLLSLEAVLEDLGENLVRANSGQEALRHVLTTDFAAILLDLHMPTMSGFEVAQIIRTRPRSKNTPIIFVTASDSGQFPIEEAYALGAVDYLTKPLNPTIFRAKVAFFVDLHRKTEELARREKLRHAAALSAKDERIRLILENAKGYGFIVTDLEGRITEWEGGSESITGWKKEEAIGQSTAIIFSPEDRANDAPQAELSKAKKTGAAEDKRWHVRKDGGRFFADGVVIPLKDADDHLHGFAKIFRDATTERLNAEEAQASQAKLHDSRRLFSLLLESSAEGIFGMGPDSRCTFSNVAGAAMLGYQPEELVGQPIHDMIQHHQADGSPYPVDDSHITKAACQGVALRVDDEVFWRKDGSAVPVSYSVSPMIVDGKPAGAVITFSDITERKSAEEKLRRLAADLSDADRRKTEFLATLAHELRNPLAPIRSGLSLMQLGGDNPATMAKVREIMDRQVNHMVHLIDDLLDIARISGGKIDLKKERVELKSVVASAIETSMPLIEAAHHQLDVSVPDVSLVLDVDHIRITQVISNLLNNSAKYTAAGGHIQLIASQEDDQVVISVKDNGIGIPQESLGSVFDMFSQVGRNIGRAQGGLGIGLALVRRLVEMHGGTVTVSSPGVGAGSTFTIRLPLVKDIQAPVVSRAMSDTGEPRTIVKQLRVLVVDDNTDAADTLSSILQLGGYQTKTAYDGGQAIKVAEEFRPDIALLDIGMPGMNGYELAQELRKMIGQDRITLIALTGWGTEKDRARSQEAGFYQHLTKPVDPAAVEAILSRVAQSRHSQDQTALHVVR